MISLSIIDNNTLKTTIRGIFLLILAVSGNFIAETLGCKSQKLLSENMYVKHIILIFILFFSIDFVKSDSRMHPKYILSMTAFVYILFIMFSRMNIHFTLFIFLLLMALYTNQTFINYYTKLTDDVSKKKAERLINIQNKCYIFVIILLIIGFIDYFMKQYKDHKKNWSTLKFIFGKPSCDSMKN